MSSNDAHGPVPEGNHLVNLAFRILEVDHQLEVVDRRSTTFRSDHDFLIEAQIPSRFFVREYFWTGSGSEQEPVPDLLTDIDLWGFPMQRIHGPLLILGDTRTLVVDLGRTIQPGERVRVRFQHRMKDLNSSFEPKLVVRPSTQVRNRIKLRVILPSWNGLRMIYERFTHDTSEVVDATPLDPVDASPDKLTFEKEVINPSEDNMGHKLAWKHQEG